MAAIIETLLKRKWPLIVLRHIERGLNDSESIMQAEPEISPEVLNNILRTMIRYRLISRSRHFASAKLISYDVTELGGKMLEILTLIEKFDTHFSTRKPSMAPNLPTLNFHKSV